MKFKKGDVVYVDNFQTNNGKIYNSYATIRNIMTNYKNNCYKIFVIIHDGNYVLGVHSEHLQFNKIKTLFELRKMKINKINKINKWKITV